MSKLLVACRLLMERLRRGNKPALLRSVQARRLYWPALGEFQTLFEWRGCRQLACIGGLAETVAESSSPGLALMRELREELGLGPCLSAQDERQFCFHHDFTLQTGEKIRFTRDGWTHVGADYRFQCEERGPIQANLPFGLRASCHVYEVYVYASVPAEAQRVEGPLPFGAKSAWRIRGQSGEVTTVLMAALDAGGDTLQESKECDWRMPPERYISVPGTVPEHYFSCLEHADGSSSFADDDPEARFFINGEFYPFGSLLRKLVPAALFAGALALFSSYALIGL